MQDQCQINPEIALDYCQSGLTSTPKGHISYNLVNISLNMNNNQLKCAFNITFQVINCIRV